MNGSVYNSIIIQSNGIRYHGWSSKINMTAVQKTQATINNETFCKMQSKAHPPPVGVAQSKSGLWSQTGSSCSKLNYINCAKRVGQNDSTAINWYQKWCEQLHFHMGSGWSENLLSFNEWNYYLKEKAHCVRKLKHKKSVSGQILFNGIISK